MIERTFAMIKPHAVADKNMGKIIARIEQEGFTIRGMQLMKMPRNKAEELYAIHKGKGFYEGMLNDITAAPLVVMVLEKENAIKEWRNLMGATNPEQAAPNTLRKLYAKSIGENATHGSDAPETAQAEITIFFPELAR